MKTKIDQFDDETFKALVDSSTSMRELTRKLGYTGSGYNGEAILARCSKLGITTDHFTGLAKGAIKRTVENIFIENSTASQTTLRKWYKKGEYTEYKCAICGLEPFWNGKELSLTLDHINGKNTDHRLENLRWVCPNCDRQLDTFCSKNPQRKQNYNAHTTNFCLDCGKEISDGSQRCQECYAISQRRCERPSKEELYEKILNSNFAAVGREYGVSDNTIRKWCKAYGLPTKASEYKTLRQ